MDKYESKICHRDNFCQSKIVTYPASLVKLLIPLGKESAKFFFAGIRLALVREREANLRYREPSYFTRV